MNLARRLCAFALFAVTMGSLPAAAADKYGIVLLDRTGSMQTVRTNGHTRCQDSIAQAHDRINVFFGPLRGTHLSIWTFDGNGVAMASPFLTNATNAHNAVDAIGPTNCNGPSTNLADAMCFAGTYLNSLNKGFTMLHVATDGYENSSTGPCSGAWGDLATPGTWEYNVYDTLTNLGVSVTTLYFVASTPLELQREASANSDIELSRQVSSKGPLSGVQSYTHCNDTTQCEGRLFRYLAGATSGQYFIVQDSNTQYPCSGSQCPAPEPGW